jgi:hypothetical protein
MPTPLTIATRKMQAALRADGDPEIALVVKEPHQTKNNGGGWHTDHSYDQQPGARIGPLRTRGAVLGRRHPIRQHCG